MIDIILGSFAVILIAGLLVINVLLRLKVSKIVAAQIQAEIDKNILIDNLNKIKEELETLKLQESDGFVKFLSESRQWAFDYIDDVQLRMKSLKLAMDVGDSEQVLVAFNELISFLPKEEEKNKEK